jgi:hypothetical protein
MGQAPLQYFLGNVTTSVTAHRLSEASYQHPYPRWVITQITDTLNLGETFHLIHCQGARRDRRQRRYDKCILDQIVEFYGCYAIVTFKKILHSGIDPNTYVCWIHTDFLHIPNELSLDADIAFTHNSTFTLITCD